jgi:RNA polymerase sigma-70 factor (ECF subfamily)
VWTAWQVQEALAQLNEDERLIMRLSFFEDLTQSEIADRLGLPLGTVKSRSYRAHRRLAALLGHLRDEAPDRRSDENRRAPAERTARAGLSIEGRGEQ